VTTESGGLVRFIASPNYPEKYFRNAKCLWRLAAQRTQRIRLTLVDFELDVRRNGVCHDQMSIISVISGSGHVVFSDCGALGKQVTANITTVSITRLKFVITVDYCYNKL